MVVKGEIEGPKYDYIANLTVSPDKKSFAYIGGQKYSKQDLIKDGENKQIIYAMIRNLQTRISFLENVLYQINTTEKLITTTDENTL